MDGVLIAEVPSQPLDAEAVAAARAGDEDVAAALDGVGRVEHRLVLGGQEALGFVLLRGHEPGREALVREARRRRGDPAGAAAEVLLAELAVRETLRRPAPPAHRRLDDLVADDEQHVARHQRVAAARDLPVRRARAAARTRTAPAAARSRPACSRRSTKRFDIALGLLQHLGRPRRTSVTLEEVPLGLVVDDRRHDDVPRRHERVLVDPPDDDLLERVPLVECVDDGRRSSVCPRDSTLPPCGRPDAGLRSDRAEPTPATISAATRRARR